MKKKRGPFFGAPLQIINKALSIMQWGKRAPTAKEKKRGGRIFY